jgi:hypothetical protein
VAVCLAYVLVLCVYKLCLAGGLPDAALDPLSAVSFKTFALSDYKFWAVCLVAVLDVCLRLCLAGLPDAALDPLFAVSKLELLDFLTT